MSKKIIGAIPTKEALEEIFLTEGATLPITSTNAGGSVLTGDVVSYSSEADTVVIRCKSIRQKKSIFEDPLGGESTRKRDMIVYA